MLLAGELDLSEGELRNVTLLSWFHIIQWLDTIDTAGIVIKMQWVVKNNWWLEAEDQTTGWP